MKSIIGSSKLYSNLVWNYLGKELPTSYSRNIFTQKNETVYTHIYHLAELGDKLYASA